MNSRSGKPTIAISGCLLGQTIRYNLGHTEDKWITHTLSKYVDFVSFCPEMEMGLGVPREEIHLTDENGEIKLRGKKSKKDLTGLAKQTYSNMTGELSKKQIDGFIMMKKSPSCGLTNVKAFDTSKSLPTVVKKGLFTSHLTQHFPHIPIEESGRLKNDILKEQFIKCVYAHYRFSQVDSISELQKFHERYKLILMDHSIENKKILGKLCANSSREKFELVMFEYKKLFFSTINIPLTSKKRFITMDYIFKYIKKYLNKRDQGLYKEIVNEYREDLTTYAAALKLISFLVKKHMISYLDGQYYFSPYPVSIKLQNGI